MDGRIKSGHDNLEGASTMARLPYLDRADLQPEDQDLLNRNINLHRLLAHSPMRCARGSSFAHFIRHKSRLDPRLRELAILQVGYLERSAYEYSHHIKIGRDFGVSDDDIRAIADGDRTAAEHLDPLSKAVLRAAREMTHGVSISERTFRRAARRARQRVPDRPGADDRLLQRGRAHPGDDADRRGGRVSAVSRRVSAAEGLGRARHCSGRPGGA